MTSARIGVCVLAVAVAHAAWADQPNPRSSTIAVSSAGGISKGSYQAGVDWTVSEFLRRQRRPEFREALRKLAAAAGHNPGTLPELRLGSATGASAGNINAMFAALGACTAEAPDLDGRLAADISAETSLFWRTWVNTGAPQLLPEERNAEAAALSRQFLDGQHLNTVRTYLASATGLDDCYVRVGVTLTKLVPEGVSLQGNDGSIGVQRFASLLDVTTVARGDRRYLDFTAVPEQVAVDGSFGALALMPRLGNRSPEMRDERLRDVFSVLLASSAFPVAFAPRILCYQPGGLVPHSPDQPARCEPFADGGVFDNNPIGLAVRLIETKDESTPPRAVYSSPDNLRGDVLYARRKAVPPPVTTGLGAARQLLAGAIGAARDYELQSLRRQIERDRELHGRERPIVMLSSRRAPIVGETMASFGAFLGRPFREYDFYTGIYDGLEFIARQFLCGVPVGTPSSDTCTASVHARLVDQNVFGLSRVAQQVVVWHRQAERRSVAVQPPVVQLPPSRQGEVERDDARLVLLELIHTTLAAHMTPRPCPSDTDLISGALCPGGLGDVLNSLSSDQAGAAADTLLRLCQPSQAVLGECSVDGDFRAMMRQPKREVYTLVRRGIRNIEGGEHADAAGGAPSIRFAAKVAYSLFRTHTMRYRDGTIKRFEISRSSSALGGDDRLATIAGLVAPNYLQDIVLNDRVDEGVLGWQPLMYIVNEKVYVNSQVQLHLSNLNADQFWSKRVTDHLAWGVSIGTNAAPRLKIARPVAVDLGVMRLPKSFPAEFVPDNRYMARLSTRWLADKFDLTVLFTHRRFLFTFGASDLNGVLYWLLR